MKRKTKIPIPFFEIGPKNYLYGDAVYDLAYIADEVAGQLNISVIFTAPYVNIEHIQATTKNLHVFAPHMDVLAPGRGLADILPESIKAAGAEGVMLNHVEKGLCPELLEKTIKRASSVQLLSIVCASSIEETKRVALLKPDMIVSEPAELIGTRQSTDVGYVKTVMDTVLGINPDIGVLVAGGISSGEDAYKIIYAGADATGSSSAIVNSDNPAGMIKEMLQAVQAAWEDRKNKQSLKVG